MSEASSCRPWNTGSRRSALAATMSRSRKAFTASFKQSELAHWRKRSWAHSLIFLH